MSNYATAGPTSTNLSSGDRTWAVVAHLSAIIAAVLSAGSLSLLGPLIVWAIKKDSPGVRQAAAGAFNFNLAFWIVYLLAWVLTITVIGAVVGIPLLVIAFVVSLWCHIRGAVAASNGMSYSYPFQIRVLH